MSELQDDLFLPNLICCSQVAVVSQRAAVAQDQAPPDDDGPRGNPAVLEFLDRVLQFKHVLPVVSALRNPALKARHWHQITAQITSGAHLQKQNTPITADLFHDPNLSVITPAMSSSPTFGCAKVTSHNTRFVVSRRVVKRGLLVPCRWEGSRGRAGVGRMRKTRVLCAARGGLGGALSREGLGGQDVKAVVVALCVGGLVLLPSRTWE